MIFRPFDKQEAFLKSTARYPGAFAGKRSGKTEVGAIKAIMNMELRPGYQENEIDPYIGIVMAPTADMLRRLSMRKLLAYAKPFLGDGDLNKTRQEITWNDKGVLYGLSADRPERLEGIKANFIWLDEVFQMPEQIFLEAMARVADTKGNIYCTGSLGIQYKNPKNHWVYKHFKEKPTSGTECHEWTTSDNPYFPKEELERLKDALDPITYRQLFEICWDTSGLNSVYGDFTEANITPDIKYNPDLETSCVIDWGWTHNCAVLYFQYDQRFDRVYLIDEIISSRLTLEKLWELMKAKPYRVQNYYCDISGNQEREQSGISNITWFKQAPRNIHFKFRKSSIVHGIAITRSYIMNARGQRRLYVSDKCTKTIDGIKNYSYDEKDGIISSELPIKKDDDAVDSLRYYFVNRLDFSKNRDQFQELSRWKLIK